MGGQREPKRKHPDEMCYLCREWGHAAIDWGECFLIAECVPGDQYKLMYAYSDCFFEKSMFARRGDGR